MYRGQAAAKAQTKSGQPAGSALPPELYQFLVAPLYVLDQLVLK